MAERATMSGSRGLLERDDELARAGAVLDDALAGRGGMVTVEGPPGIGKTALLDAVAALAVDLGMAALRGRGSELELDLPFTVVRQLFEARVTRAGPEERARVLGGAASLATAALHLGGPTVQMADPFTVTHALYWLCANLAELHPLLLVVDDVHWADVQSLRWLAYMRARLEDLPVAIVAAARPAAAGAPAELLRIALPAASASVLRPGALSLHGATAFLQAHLLDADVAFCEACAVATGGNPFLLSELAGAVRSQGIAPTAEAARLVAQLISPGVSRSVLLRLGPLGTEARRVGEALAVLGPGVNLAQAARLAQVSLSAAATASDRLRQASILRPDDSLDFLHPLLRSAVYNDITPAARRALHRRAAGILADDGVGVEQVASHLLGSEPAGDPWVVDRLLEAARRSLSAGAPDAGARYLARAAEEPPALSLRAEVLYRLGLATMTTSPHSAIPHLRAALTYDPTPELRVGVTITLAKVLAHADQPAESVAVLGRALDSGAGDRDATMRLEAERVLWQTFWADDPERATRTDRLRALVDGSGGHTVGERSLYGLLAWDLVVQGAPAGQAVAAAQMAIGSALTFTDPEQGFEIPTVASLVFMYCDELDRAWTHFDGGVREFRDQGWRGTHLAFTYSHRAHVALRQGRLLEAEADATTSWEIIREFGPQVPAWWYALGNLVQVLVARGSLPVAAQLLGDNQLGDALPDAVIFPLPKVVRGELRLAIGQNTAGIRDLLEAGDWLEKRGFVNPSWSPWRTSVAPAMATSGRAAEALDIATEAQGRADSFGAPWARGRALEALGLIRGGDDGIQLLHEAVGVLADSPCRYDHAGALVRLGAALRRTNRRIDAREPLSEGLDLAERCGAAGLARQAREELVATGARPRRLRRTGYAALTASELRVARLATEGLSNPEIAQMLFVSRKTVEKHLAGAYSKLGINARSDLGQALMHDD